MSQNVGSSQTEEPVFLSSVSYKECAPAEPQTVADVMTREVVFTNPDTTLDAALLSMLSAGCHRLPVLDTDGKLLGIVSDRDFRLAARSPFVDTTDQIVADLKHHKVHEVMTTTMITVESSAPIVEAVKLMRVARVGGLPVVESVQTATGSVERVVGIITRTNLLDCLIRQYEPVPPAD
eukprot:TRINITY_DN5842_c0_g1_i1.p2 TRINITY_DN5842_c0_g1~~TRINITY_DN5842_c0_g1_i1.p2  ORF type:complete len:179 (-),score=75.96 TRINITY_DN5842_c0_g1_i1:237-773(-)